MESSLISIIVPVYNVKDYIDECLQSIISQTYKNIEIILVDDGSTDGCREICDNYAAKDDRIFVIHKKNEGLSSARNTGLQIAKGTHIGFVDSDDYIDKYMYEKLINAIDKNNADVSVCGYWYLHPQYDNNKNFGKENFILPGNEAIIKTFFEMPYMYAAWNKLYKASLFKNFEFPNCYYEDLNSLYTVFCTANKISFINEPLYFYNYRDNSIHESFWTKDTFTKIKNTINALENMAEYHALSEYKQYFLYGKIWDYSAEYFKYLSNLHPNNEKEILSYLFNVLYTKCSSKFIDKTNMYTYIWRFLYEVKNVNYIIRKQCHNYIKEEIISNCTKENLSAFQKIKLALYMRFPQLII